MAAMFLVRWEGEAPPDKVEWLAAVRQALADEVGIYRVHFHREPSGWRFDLECRSEAGSEQPTVTPASESVALNVYALLAEGGKPLDPDWDPLAPPPSEAPVGDEPAVSGVPRVRVAPVALVEPATTTDPAAVPPLQEGAEAEDAGLERPTPGTLEPAASPEAPEAKLSSALRPGRWPGLRVGGGRLAIVALALATGWLAWDRIRTPATPPLATPSAEAVAAQDRLKQLEAVVAQLQREKQEDARPAPLETSRPPRTAPTAGPARPRATLLATVAPGVRATLTPEAGEPPPPTLEPVALPTPTPAPPPAAMPTEPEAAAPAPVEPGALVDLTDPGVTRPVVVAQGQPRYPPLALQRGIEGTVVVSVLVDETGAVAEASVVRASPRGLGFEDAATRYVRSRRYQPATKGGVPVRVRIEVAVEFRKPGSR
jgi:protein TonB